MESQGVTGKGFFFVYTRSLGHVGYHFSQKVSFGTGPIKRF